MIRRNSFFAHPKVLLISVITDDRKQAHELGIRGISKAHQHPQSSLTNQALRQFRFLKLNFACKDYTEMNNWAIETVTEPALTFALSNQS